jgi:carboxyl-terminal processing protease
MINEEIGYITLTTFTQQAGENVANALNDLKKNPKLKAVIFDLRGNGGGLLNEAVNVSNVFIKNNELVVTTRGKVKEWDRNFKTSSEPVDLDIPLVILTDKGSASASEIVSGVIQDLDRGVILGQKSYGKGLVQNTLDVGYNSRVKVTIAKYYIPSGRCIQAVSYKNGEPIEIPDSEKAKFKTRNGREVLDGGGIYPDVKIAKDAIANVTKSLMINNLIFDYATLYAIKNATIKGAKEYGMTDAEYEAFVKFVKAKAHNYETGSEKMLQDLEKKAAEENYLSTIEADLNAMRQKIEQDKTQDIYKYKKQIKDLLEREIVSRYYFEKGKIELGLQNDEEIKEAIKVLNDADLYKKLLAKQ